jgi:hypothetical protein
MSCCALQDEQRDVTPQEIQRRQGRGAVEPTTAVANAKNDPKMVDFTMTNDETW